jgi:hypothetical protein
VEHPNVREVREIKHLHGRSILFLETDLVVSLNDRDFDANAFRDLEAAAQSYIHTHLANHFASDALGSS